MKKRKAQPSRSLCTQRSCSAQSLFCFVAKFILEAFRHFSIYVKQIYKYTMKRESYGQLSAKSEQNIRRKHFHTFMRNLFCGIILFLTTPCRCCTFISQLAACLRFMYSQFIFGTVWRRVSFSSFWK